MIHSAQRTRKPLGLILYSGPSQIDGKPITAIATGFQRRSANAKTGNMIQTFIIRSDVSPVAAINNGDDSSICGSCPLRGYIQLPHGDNERPVNRHRACYVAVHQSPSSVFRAFKRGRYEQFDRREHLELFENRMLRLGAYGDPTAVPYSVWTPLLEVSSGWTGYSHEWRNGRFWRYRRFLMASCESLADAREAQSRGYRTFRSALPGDEAAKGEFRCPASAEAGKRLTCENCGVCNGANGNPRRASVFITMHGSPAVQSSYRRVIDDS